VVCPTCGTDNRTEARFCDTCGSPLGAPEPTTEQRKTVTILFCDITGSTELGEALDPEPLRRLLARYFEQMKWIVEAHGGMVEKFIGDAVMAVFGIPAVHEDDALRAARAATEMQRAMSQLGLQGRIGINSGEVVTGTDERLATGDPVNVAARLEQAAAPGETVLGDATVRLIRDAVEVEALEPLALKGKTETVAAYRLVSVTGDTPVARRIDGLFVSRDRELRLLREAYELAAGDRTCHLVTVLGPAGIGKSRLAREFLSGLEQPRVVQGRCLSYGNGITYWPVVAVVKQLQPDGWELEPSTREALRSLLGDDVPASTDEIAVAVRSLFEAAAADRPLVVVFDDIHWAEPTFLELVEHVADWSRGAPILLLCLARPELLDLRPGWGGGKFNALTLLLEPLRSDASEALLDGLLEQAQEEAVRKRILEIAEGNPLFVEEMVAMLREVACGEVDVPPTIHALLAARLDLLTPPERVAAERASIEGAIFHRSTVEELAPEVTGADLMGLVRKQIIRPEDVSYLKGDQAFRFRHGLIRDAAYAGLAKATRADLHLRFADSLESRRVDLVELAELVGYHLEQAAQYRRELGLDGAAIAGRAAERLAAAGALALEREDAPAAANLLGRAAGLMETNDIGRVRLLPLLGRALYDVGELERADVVLTEAVELGERAGRAATAAHGRLLRAHLRGHADGAKGLRAIEEETLAVIPVLEQLGDDRGLARAYVTLGWRHFWAGRAAEQYRNAARALEHARRGDDRRLQAEALAGMVRALVFGRTPWRHVERFVAERVAPERERLGPRGAILGIPTLADAAAAQGRFGDARELYARARAHFERQGWRLAVMTLANQTGPAELLAGDFAAAERELRAGYSALGRIGEDGYRSMITALLAEAVLEQGRTEEALRLAEEAYELAGATGADFSTLVVVQFVRARVASARGDHEDAIAAARNAVKLVGATDFTTAQADARRVLGEVLVAAGSADDASEALGQALALYERKGSTALAQRTRALLARCCSAVLDTPA